MNDEYKSAIDERKVQFTELMRLNPYDGGWVSYTPSKKTYVIDGAGNVGRMVDDKTVPWGGELTLTLDHSVVNEDILKEILGLNTVTTKQNNKFWPNDLHNVIYDYSYSNGTTTITWLDGSKTKCYCDPDKADQYTGFMIALAKHAFGNHNEATNLADYWINKKPKIERKAEAKRIAEKTEQARIEEKRKERRAKNRIRRAAIRRAEEYQAKKIANEKYGVPMDFKE